MVQFSVCGQDVLQLSQGGLGDIPDSCTNKIVCLVTF